MPTRPGLHPEVDLSQYPPLIARAVRALALNFYVTRSFMPERIGNSEYWAVLARPTDDFSIYLNADREILVLFADYENFEIRTLEAYDTFYATLESKRTDRSLRFLVSNDGRIEGIVRHYLNQNPEYPIIIPVTFDGIHSSSGNPLLEAIRRNYLLRDLFGYQNPLREETFFFGRQDVVTSVLDMAKSGQSSCLFGLRKSGKTSTIYAIQRKSKGFSCVTTVIDCQNPAVHARHYDKLLAHVVSEVRQTIGQSKRIDSLGTTPDAVAEAFSQHMKAALGQAKSNVLVIFDEIENISPTTAASAHWRSSDDAVYFWQIIRSFVQGPSQGKLSICLVGTSPQLLEMPVINNVPNPMYLFSQKRFLPSLDYDETRNMIERLGYFMGLEFSADLIMDLQKEYGGHPFFIRQVCSKAHQLAPTYRPTRVSKRLLQQAKAEFGGQLQSYLRDILTQLKDNYPGEYELLGSVVRGERSEINEYGRDAPELIDHLIGYGIVERDGDDVDIRFNAVRVELESIFRPDTRETRWAEISQRRNALEQAIRSAMYHSCLSIAPDDWEAVIQKNLTKSRLENLTDRQPRILFSSRSSPLYFSDLLMLIRDNRLLPYLGERRTLVVSHMDTVNKIRKDAHANEVTDTEMARFRTALDYLEHEFAQP